METLHPSKQSLGQAGVLTQQSGELGTKGPRGVSPVPAFPHQAGWDLQRHSWQLLRGEAVVYARPRPWGTGDRC